MSAQNLLRTENEMPTQPQVRVGEKSVIVPLPGGVRELPLMPLPDNVIAWLEQGRRGVYDKLLQKGAPLFHASHLPVMVTFNEGRDFPFNCSNKGVGLIPKPQYLQHYIHLFRGIMEKTKGRPWQESLAERIQAVSKFYFRRDVIDYRALTTLEIFERTTYQNLRRNPVASLHYTGNAPDYMSFQVDSVVEIIGPDDPRHEFIRLARTMFEFDSFHIAQHEFPHAYILWVNQVQDKTPFRVPEKPNKVAHMPSRGGLEWDADAMDSVNRAPGMIRQFITEQIEKYARRRDFARVTLQVVREAREVMERQAPGEEAGHGEASKTDVAPSGSSTDASPSAFHGTGAASSHGDASDLSRYRSVYVGLDSSPLANAATEIAVKMGKAFDAKLHGSHVYAAKMHDNRFRAMEGGLPPEYQQEQELEKQRKIHDSLITKGLELITDSYLEVMAKACAREGLSYSPVSLEGKNWQKLVEDINRNEHDLIAFGGFGIGRVGRSQLGSVTERTLRRVARDFLVVKQNDEDNRGDAIVVCLDGSERSWGGLYRAFALAKAFEKRLIAVSAFDPYFHYAMFKSLNTALSDKARKVFKFEEQEKLHEDIIDSGLAKIYQSYLNIAARLAEREGLALETRLLDGKPFEKILQFTETIQPWLVVLGRTGFHSEEGMDLGSNTENILRQCGFNVLVTESKAKPPVEFQAEESVAWTVEAKAKLDGVPPMARPMAMKAIQNYCIAEGHTVVSESILHAALKAILPAEALARMGLNLEAKQKAEAAQLDTITLSYRCPVCGYVHQNQRPQSCPVCGRDGALFKLMGDAPAIAGEALNTLGDRRLLWEPQALERLDQVGDAFERQQLRNRIEKRAMADHQSSITLARVDAALDVSHFGSQAAPAAHVTPAATPIALAATGTELLWTEAALQRLEKVPAGFMRHAAKSTIEKHARQSGQSMVTLEIIEAGLGQAREIMREAMASRGLGEGHQPPAVHADQASMHWECHLCGLVIDGHKPGACPNCGKSVFMALSPEKRREASVSATQALHWNEEALSRLQRVPEGFMREMTRLRVEKWARSHGQIHVDFSVMGDKYDSWGEGSAKQVTTMPWSEEALARAMKIPAFIRGIVMKEIEKRVRSLGQEQIEASHLADAMNYWQQSGNFHGG